MYEKSGGSGNLSTPILSYDSNNRKLTYTVETNKNSVIYNDGHVSSNTSVNVTLGIYLIYFE